MNPSPENHEKLAHLVHRALRDQPLRRAPRSLEQRVFAALAQRAALPWWRQSFSHWPQAARGAFLVLTAALAGVLVWVLSGFDVQQAAGALAPQFTWVASVRVIGSSLADFGTIIFRSIAPVWLYGIAALILALYAALFGLGTAAYRTLYVNR